MLKKQKKGFTIVELVVVIAVIAILAAVLIPTFAGLIKKAQISNDQTLVRNLNTSLAISSEGGAGKSTMYETLEDMREQGYNVDKLTPTHNKNDIVWDSVRNQFVLVMENNEYYTGTNFDDYSNVDKTTLWKVYKEMPTESEYSIYLANESYSKSVTVNGVGFDAGNNSKITVISYKNTTGNANDHAVIRTNAGTELTVNAQSDAVSHYGVAKQVNVDAVANNSYHEYGEVTTVVVKTGRVVIEEKANVALVVAPTDKLSNPQNVKIEVPSGKTKVYAPEGVEISSPNNTVKSSGELKNNEIDYAVNDVNSDEKQFSGGLGIESNPYLIATTEDAMKIKNLNSSTLSKFYLKLTNDIKINNEIYMSAKTYIVDLNGHSITLKYDEGITPNYGGVFNVSGISKSGRVTSGNLTIYDSSEAQTGAVYGSTQTFTNKVTSAVCVRNYGKLTINGGHFYGRSEGTSCIFVYTSISSNSKATVTINGGVFETSTPSNGTYFVLNHQDSTTAGCTITVNGGRFKNYNPGVTAVDPANAYTGKIVLGSGCSTTTEADANGKDTWYVVSKTQTTESAS